MQPRNVSKIRAAWVCPCVGVGGADAYMLGICRYANNVNWTGIAVHQQITVYNYEWAMAMCGYKVPLHQVHGHNQYQIESHITYHDSLDNAVSGAARDADIIISWCIPDLKNYFWSMDKPIVELAQNTDQFAVDCCKSNEAIVSFRVACSQAATNAFRDPSSVDAVIYNAIDPGRVTPRYGREFTRKVLGLDDKKIVLYMGRLVEEKNPQGLIQAIREMSDDWCLVVVGKGYLDEVFTKEAARYAPGRVFSMDAQYHVGDLLAAADVFCLPTDFEGHPLAVCEAWLAGVPVVTTEIPVIQELESMYGPMCVKTGLRPDPKELIPALIEAQSQTPEVLDMMNRARAVTWEHFTLPAAAVKWEEFLANCLAQWQKYQRRFELFPINRLAPKTSSYTRIKTTSNA